MSDEKSKVFEDEFMNEYVKKNASEFVVNGIYKYYE